MSISRLIAGISIATVLTLAYCVPAFAQETVVVRPKEIDDILLNPESAL